MHIGTKGPTEENHAYVQYGGRFWRRDLGLARLLRLVSTNRGRRRSDLLSLNRRGLARLFLELGPARHIRGHRLPLLELPFCGDIVLRVHRGYKVFDFDNARVTKVFDTDVPVEEVMREQRAVRLCNDLGFAPRIHVPRDSARWYREELISGRHISRGPGAPDERYGDALMGCLGALATAHTPHWVDTSAHAAELQKQLAELANPLPDSVAKPVQRFAAGILKELEKSDTAVPLVASHGDFLADNVLDTPDGIKLLDWESAGRRSAMHDFYNFYVTEVYQRRMSLPGFYATTAKRLKQLCCILDTHDRRLGTMLKQGPSPLMRLYWLERFVVLLNRQWDARLQRVIGRSTRLFRIIDRMAASYQPLLPVRRHASTPVNGSVDGTAV